MIRPMRSSGSGKSSRITCARSRPVSSSIAMYSVPSRSSPESMIWIEFGWLSSEALFASRLKRATSLSSLSRWWWRTFTATGLPSEICNAL